MPIYPFLKDDNEGVLRAMRSILLSRLENKPLTEAEKELQKKDIAELKEIETKLKLPLSMQ